MPPKTRSRTRAEGAPPPPSKGQSGRSSRSGRPVAPTKKSKKRKAVDVLPNPEAEPDEDTTDRSQVNRPIDKYVHPSMSGAWAISKRFQMCIIFDSVNPLRQFKRNSVFNQNDDDPFPLFNPRKRAEITESDYEGRLQPYRPVAYMCANIFAQTYIIR